MIRRGYEAPASSFFTQFSSCFKSNNTELNREINLLESVKTISDIKSSLEFDKYLKNKI